MDPLAIENLTKSYKGKLAVDEVSFDIKSGEIFGLLGPNGAGKTTIISMIVTLQRPSSGTIHIFGHDVQENPLQAKRLLGFVPQELIHHGYFSVKEVLELHCSLYGYRDRERVDYLLNRLALWPQRDKLVSTLSGGMKRRLLIAKALIHKPQLLLLDEPSAGVDIELRSSLWQLIEELRDEGLSILLTTHYLEEAENLCSRIAILQEGKIKRLDSTEKLLSEYSCREMHISLHAEPEPIEHPYLSKQSGRFLELRIPSALPMRSVFSQLPISWADVENLSISEGNLEEVMRNVLEEK